MNWTPDDWARLGARIRAERERQGLSRAALVERSGVAVGTIQNVEGQAVPKGRWPQSLGAIEKAFGWAPGSMKAILDGGEPRFRVGTKAEGCDEAQAVSIPAALYADLVAIAAHVSAGRSAAFVQERPYPDALARRTLGALDDAGLLPDRHPTDADGAAKLNP